MKEKLLKLFQSISTVLRDIGGGDIMGLYATIWGTIFLGSALFLYQTNKIAAIVLLLLSPIPIFIFTVITKLIVDKFANLLPSPEEKQENKDIPKFYTRNNHAELVIKNANANDVAKFLLQFLDDIPIFLELEKSTVITKGGEYYSPEKDDIGYYGFVFHGEESVAQHGYFEVGHAKMTADPQRILLLELLFIAIVQGGRDTTKVKFDSDHRKDIFIRLGKMILKELKENFSVSNVVGLPEEPEIIMTLPESEFGLGDKVKLVINNNNNSNDAEMCFARFEYIGILSSMEGKNYVHKFEKHYYQKNVLWNRKSTEDGTINIAAEGEDVLDIIEVTDEGFNFLFHGGDKYTQSFSPDTSRPFNDYLFSIKVYGKLGGQQIKNCEERYIAHFEFIPIRKKKNRDGIRLISPSLRHEYKSKLTIRKADIGDIKEFKGAEIREKE